ncbi:MAG: hypothetical protein Q9192_003654 [Flavoplaca navasiana]
MISIFLTAGILGLLAHWLLFIHGEWHLSAAAVVTSHVIAICLLLGFESQLHGSLSGSASTTAVTVICYFVSLYTSVVAYRARFHRLRNFPGPRLAAISKLWHVWQCRDSRNHLVLDRLQRQYGQFVRTGPNEITVFHPEALEAIDGHNSTTTRSDWYDLLYPRLSSIFTRDKALHDERRRIWLQSLSSKEVAQYHPRVLGKVSLLGERIAQAGSQPVLVNDLMQRFSYELMGDFGFSEDFGTTEYHRAHQKQHSALSLLGPFSQAIWIPRLGFAFIPGLWKVKDWFDMLKFTEGLMERRMKTDAKQRDIASWFIQDVDDNPGHTRWLNGEAATLVVAGSATTPPTLSTLFYLLARHPDDMEIITQELSTVDVQDVKAVALLPHLNGAINEAMRLLPAIATSGTRVTPPEGLTIAETFIPGDVKVAAPRYSIGRSRTSCVGKNLALTSIRMVIASLLATYHISFAPGDNGKAVERDMKDQLVAVPGDLYLVFERRQQS